MGNMPKCNALVICEHHQTGLNNKVTLHNLFNGRRVPTAPTEENPLTLPLTIFFSVVGCEKGQQFVIEGDDNCMRWSKDGEVWDGEFEITYTAEDAAANGEYVDAKSQPLPFVFVAKRAGLFELRLRYAIGSKPAIGYAWLLLQPEDA